MVSQGTCVAHFVCVLLPLHAGPRPSGPFFVSEYCCIMLEQQIKLIKICEIRFAVTLSFNYAVSSGLNSVQPSKRTQRHPCEKN